MEEGGEGLAVELLRCSERAMLGHRVKLRILGMYALIVGLARKRA